MKNNNIIYLSHFIDRKTPTYGNRSKIIIDQTSSIKDGDTANSFIVSKEFITKYGNQTTNEEYLNNVYQNILDRSPDTIGFNYWINQLNVGNENRAEILMGFAESVENKQIFSAETNLF